MLDKMTPAQRAEMEAAMKKEAAKGPQTETERECITEKDLENPFESDTEGCTTFTYRPVSSAAWSGGEVHVATDLGSSAYRRYLRERGITFGVC